MSSEDQDFQVHVQQKVQQTDYDNDINIQLKQHQEHTNQDMILQTNRWQQAQTQQISRVNKATPLVFKLQIGDNYFISYRQNFSSRFIPQILSIGGLGIGVILALQYLILPQWAKRSLIALVLINILLFLTISFLDAGTLFQDEQQSFDDQRIYCSVCGFYRLQTTRHCVWCNKCIRKYDHHCSFFGKCIGARNIIFFWLFAFGSSATMVACFIAIIYGIIAANTITKT